MSPVAPAIRVLVADDQAPFRRAARAVIRATPGFELIGEVCSGEQAVEFAALLHVDLVLIDVNMPGIGGIEAARRLVGPVTVLISSYREEELPLDAGSCGAAAYIHKPDFGPRVLREAWDAAASGTSLPPPRGTPAPPSPSGARSPPS